MRVKDKLRRNDRAGMVYRAPCSCGAEYVGETGQTIGQRIIKYRKAFECNYPRRSAVAKHGLKAGHVPLWESVSIMGATPRKARRWSLKAWHAEETVKSLTE